VERPDPPATQTTQTGIDELDGGFADDVIANQKLGPLRADLTKVRATVRW